MGTYGYIYFLAESNRVDPKIKIGKTNSLNRRLNQIHPQLPTKTTLLHSIRTDDRHTLEIIFHVAFQNKRINGEWFDLEADDMLEIINLTTVYFDDDTIWEI